MYKEPTVKKKKKKDSSDISEDEDITSLLVKAASDSFKEPAVTRRASNGSRASRRSHFDAFSDDEELLSVSQRPSVSSNVSRSRTSSTLSSKFDRVSFSSTINRLLDGVFTKPAEVTNGSIETNEAENSFANNEEISEPVKEQEESVNISEEVKTDEVNIEASNERSSKSSRLSKSSKKREDQRPSQSDSSRLEDFSEDELGDLKPTNQKTEERSASLDWLVSLFFMILSPVILISLHNYSSQTSLSLLNPRGFWDTGAFLTVTGFLLSLFLCEFVCMGKMVEGFRMNGKQSGSITSLHLHHRDEFLSHCYPLQVSRPWCWPCWRCLASWVTGCPWPRWLTTTAS